MKAATFTASEIGRLVEHQMRNWELAKSQRLALEPETRTQVPDFICISREVGVGANQIAALVSERLGWPVFDKEILHAMAGDDALRERVYASMDERDLGWCEETLRSFLDPRFFKSDYFYELTKTILSLARQGSAVFVGRGADLILPPDAGRRVRIIAPLEVRIRNMALRLGVPEGQARQEVEKLEEERARYIRRHFHADVHDARRYDLVINLQRLSPTQAAELILESRTVLSVGPVRKGS